MMKMWQKMRSKRKGGTEKRCTSRGKNRRERNAGSGGVDPRSWSISFEARKAVPQRMKQKARISLLAIRLAIIRRLIAPSPFAGDGSLLFAAAKIISPPRRGHLLFFSILPPSSFSPSRKRNRGGKVIVVITPSSLSDRLSVCLSPSLAPSLHRSKSHRRSYAVACLSGESEKIVLVACKLAERTRFPLSPSCPSAVNVPVLAPRR